MSRRVDDEDRAYTMSEAVQLALADVVARDRTRRKLRKFFARADRIKRQPGWQPWWEPPTVCPKGHVDPDWHFPAGVRRCGVCERARNRGWRQRSLKEGPHA